MGFFNRSNECMIIYHVKCRKLCEILLLLVTLTSEITYTAPQETDLSPQRDCKWIGFFWCSRSHRCVHRSFMCNHAYDCTYGEDEANCSSSCAQQGQFWCSKSDICVKQSSRCNGLYDCKYGEDEANCSSYCAETGRLWCSKGSRCLWNSSWCDGHNDCPHGEDEANCSSYCAQTGRRWCSEGGRCLWNSSWCDGHDDCTYGEDEANCSSFCTQGGGFWCNQSSTCVQPSSLCNAFPDCIYREDEANCSRFCNQKGKFWCDKSSRCVRASYRCDNFKDCSYGEDEDNCSNPTKASIDTDLLLTITLPLVLGTALLIVSLFIIYKYYCKTNYRIRSRLFARAGLRTTPNFETGESGSRTTLTSHGTQRSSELEPQFHLNRSSESAQHDAEVTQPAFEASGHGSVIGSQTRPAIPAFTLPPLYCELVSSFASTALEDEEPPPYDSVNYVESRNL